MKKIRLQNRMLWFKDSYFCVGYEFGGDHNICAELSSYHTDVLIKIIGQDLGYDIEQPNPKFRNGYSTIPSYKLPYFWKVWPISRYNPSFKIGCEKLTRPQLTKLFKFLCDNADCEYDE